MKPTHLILLFAILGLALSTVDYTQTNSLGSSCTPSGSSKSSPVNFANTNCAPYGDFSLNFADQTLTPSFDSQLQNFAATYSTGTLKFNGTTYTTDRIAFHYKGEHALAGNVGDLEMQIYLKDGNGNMAGAIAFMFFDVNGSTQVVNNGRIKAYNENPANQIITSLGSTWTLQLSKIMNTINAKNDNDLFLNIHYYQGTPNYPTTGTCSPFVWFVYGSQLLVSTAQLNQFKSYLSTISGVTLSSGMNSLNYANYGKDDNDVTKLCYTGYFQVTLYANYGLWFSLGLTLLFFIFTLSMEPKPINNVNYTDNIWTLHPIYSVYLVGNEIFTRKSRSALIYFSVVNFFVWNALFFKKAYDNGTGTDGANVIAFPLQSIAITWALGYIPGFPLRKYYQRKYNYETQRKDEEDDMGQFWLYMFYLVIFIGMWICLAWTVSLMDRINAHVEVATSNLWVASLFVSMALEWLVFDPFFCLVAKWSPKYRDWAKWRGFMYDEMCHKTYLENLKRE